MKPWEVEEIRRAVKGKWLQRASGAMQFNGRISTDSRKAKAGELFVAIEGPNHDAHRFLRDVIDKGVAVVLVHKEQPQDVILRAQTRDVTILQVDNTVAAL